jgi:hypothetical protein
MKVEKVFASIAGHLGVYHERRILEMCEQVLDVEALSDQIIELTARKKQSVRQSPKILAMIVLVRK